MKLGILSDLHLEYGGLRQPLEIPDADVCVMAGDIMRAPANSIHWLATNIAPAMPCVFVAGNHEFYRGSLNEGLDDGLASSAQFPDVHFLENDQVVLSGARFNGATLWTDYRIEGNQTLAMHAASSGMNDHRQIALQRNPWKRFLPSDAYHRHQQSRAFIMRALRVPFGGPTIVITHHLPSARSVPARFKGDLLNAAFASNLEEIIEFGRPNLWVHGHIHDSCDYQIGGTRVVCNPRGYDDGENLAFDRRFVVEVGE